MRIHPFVLPSYHPAARPCLRREGSEAVDRSREEAQPLDSKELLD